VAHFSQIHSVAGYLPYRVLENAELAEASGWTAEEIFAKTGIRQRHIAAGDESTSDLAAAALKRLMESSGVAASELEFLILCTQTPDYILPTTACIVQSACGLPTTCAAFDINLGCSGYVYALAMADSFIRSGLFKTGVIVTSDTYTRYIHPEDRSTRTIFGDGATATLIRHAERPGLQAFSFGTDGRGAKNLIIPAGGTRTRCASATKEPQADKSGNVRTAEHIYMNGPEIFTFTLQRVPEIIRQTLTKAELSMEQVDVFFFHQANQYMLEHLRKKLGIPAEKMVGRLADIGNTVSSSIPFAIESAKASGIVKTGQRAMLVGFGVGYSWSAALWDI
jgi:3-oxoacyl-[acyl-carrier-protein] synthase III